MLRLGTPVNVQGRDGLGREGTIVARTLAGERLYDVRLADGSVLNYVRESDLEPMPASLALASRRRSAI